MAAAVLLLQLIGGSLLALLAYIIINPVNRWRYRHIPGPRYRPIVGNLPEFVSLSSHEFFNQCSRKYGKVFKIWFGAQPWVIVVDAEMGRKVNYKFLNRPKSIQNPLARGELIKEENKGLFFARNDVWRVLHKAWEPTFYPDSVTGYSPLMKGCGVKLADRLEQLAAEGAPINIWREVGDLTMAVVGKSAFGIDFQTIGESDKPETPDETKQQQQKHHLRLGVQPSHHFAASANAEQDLNGKKLVEAAKSIFASTAISNQSIYATVARLVPKFLHKPVSIIAHMFPDKRLRVLSEAQRSIFIASSQLIMQQRKAMASDSGGQASPTSSRPASLDGRSDNGSSAIADAPSSAESSPRASAIVRVAPRRRGPIAPGSFLGLLLSAKDKVTGHSLTEFSMVLQASTFMLAGYETTANALAYCIFCLSTNPAAEERLRQELKEGLGEGEMVASHEIEKRFPYLCAVVSESLRIFPPGASVSREVGDTPLELGGYTIPAHSPIFVATYSLHHSNEYWPRAGEFLPERWLPGNEHLAATHPGAYLPFGSGPRMCIGFRFALLEIQITLLELYRRFSFQVHWPSMQPPRKVAKSASANTAVAAGGADGEEAVVQDLGEKLRLMNGITLSPVGGIWVTAETLKQQ